MLLNDIHLRERVHSVVKLAECTLTFLGCIVYNVLIMFGTALCVIASIS